MLGIVTSDCEGIMLVLVVNTNVKDYVLMEEESIIEVSRGLLLIFLYLSWSGPHASLLSTHASQV